MFNPKRLELARKRRKLTGKMLSELVGISEVTISRLTSGESSNPTDDTIHKIADVLGYPVSFFYQEDHECIASETVSFRSMKKMTAKVRDAAISGGELGLMLVAWADKQFNLPTPDLIDLSNENDPETAAAILRNYWCIGEKPIGNMIGFLESKGIRVLSLTEETEVVDAFSFWKGDQPFIVLNTFKTAEHSRFDAAHELAHLVLHRHGTYYPNEEEGGSLESLSYKKRIRDGDAPPVTMLLDEHRGKQKSKFNGERDVEREANRFASAFLMPRSDVLANSSRFTTTASIIQNKKRWKVSAMALAYRLRALGKINDWQYRGLVIELGRLGYRNGEPDGIERENSIVWQQIFTYLWQSRQTKEHVAHELSIPLDELESLVGGLLNRSKVINNGADSKANTINNSPNPDAKNHLRTVK